MKETATVIKPTVDGRFEPINSFFFLYIYFWRNNVTVKFIVI